METKTFQIPAAVIEKVQSALNMAVGITSVYARQSHTSIMEAAIALDDAINVGDDDEP